LSNIAFFVKMDKIWNEANKEVMAPLRKVPGLVKPSGQLDHEVKKFRDSIQKKTLVELKDLLTRQEAILSNTRLVQKLPDKGLKVKTKKAEIENLINSRRKAADEAADLMKGLKLVDTDAMEWKYGSMFKHLNNNNTHEESENVKHDPEKENVFRTLATKEVPDKKTQEYTFELAEKFDARVTKNELKTAPFNQLKRTELDDKSKTKIPLKRQEDRDGIRTRKIEVMPLPPGNYDRIVVQQIDLKESLELQKEQMKRFKDVQMKSTIEKLSQGEYAKPPQATNEDFDGTSEGNMAYREKESESEDEEEEEIIADKIMAPANQTLDSDDSEDES